LLHIKTSDIQIVLELAKVGATEYKSDRAMKQSCSLLRSDQPQTKDIVGKYVPVRSSKFIRRLLHPFTPYTPRYVGIRRYHLLRGGLEEEFSPSRASSLRTMSFIQISRRVQIGLPSKFITALTLKKLLLGKIWKEVESLRRSSGVLCRIQLRSILKRLFCIIKYWRKYIKPGRM
jgi:hypothetical protein